MVDITIFIKFFTALFAVLNPIGAAPIFIAIADGQSKSERYRSIIIVAITVFLILCFFSIFGIGLLKLFGISMGSFQVAGGLILLLMALSMLSGERSKIKEEKQDENPAIFPFAFPLLAGPGAIATVIVTVDQNPGFYNLIATNGVILLISLTVVISLLLSSVMAERLGRTGINIIARFMGILLAAIAVEIIAGGLMTLFPALVI